MLETGVLRYEVDIYNLVKSLFYEKLKYFNIPLPTKWEQNERGDTFVVLNSSLKFLSKIF